MPTKRRWNDNNCYNKYDYYVHIYCPKCNHSMYFKRNHQATCQWCGTMVYPSKRSEFKDKIKKLKRKREKENE